MTETEIENNIRTILSGVLYFNHKGKCYKILSPSSDDYALAHFVANNYYKSLIFNDLLTQEECEKYLQSSGIWTAEDEDKYKISESEIEKLKVSLFESRIHKKKCKSIRSRLKGIRKAITEANNKKYYLYDKTIEYHYNFVVNKYLTAISIANLDSGRLFEKGAVLDISEPIIDKAYNTFTMFSFSQSEYREMVRSGNWSSFWNCAQERVCGSNFSDLTVPQRTMISYSKMYDNARQSLECPEDDVFKDDDMFDGWMIKQAEEAKERRKENSSNSKHSDRMSKAGEIFTLTQDQEEAQEIFDSNTHEAKAKVQQRRKQVQLNPEGISEEQLPDVKIELRKKFIEQVKGR